MADDWRGVGTIQTGTQKHLLQIKWDQASKLTQLDIAPLEMFGNGANSACCKGGQTSEVETLN